MAWSPMSLGMIPFRSDASGISFLPRRSSTIKVNFTEFCNNTHEIIQTKHIHRFFLNRVFYNNPGEKNSRDGRNVEGASEHFKRRFINRSAMNIYGCHYGSILRVKLE